MMKLTNVSTCSHAPAWNTP